MVVVELLEPVSVQNGGRHNTGERAAFEERIASDLITRGKAKPVVRAVAAPPVDKRVDSPPQQKSRLKAR